MNTNTDYASIYYADMSKDLTVLEKNVREFPASSVARFLLLYHLKKNNEPRYEEVAKQTGIYLYDPLWIEFQLSKLQPEPENELDENVPQSVIKEETETFQLPEKQEEFAAPIIPVDDDELSAVNEQISENLLLETESSETTNEELSNETERENRIEAHEELIVQNTEEEALPVAVNEQISENLPLQTESSETTNEEWSNETEGEIIIETHEELFVQNTEEEELPVAVNEEISENIPLETENQSGEFSEKINEEADLNNEFVEVPIVEEANEETVSDENIPGLQLQEKENEAVSTPGDEETKFNEDESVFKVKIPGEEDNIAGKSFDGTETADEESEDSAVPFEPLHTVDYFASQGIRLSEEALNNDQLGKQVKSFTAWLKSMKKLHPGQLPEQNEVIEKLIQTSSEASNENANVLTEAMADVLVKQGKRGKAIEMFQKLSLINPSKSAYFAAKIESLKTD